MHTFIPPQFDNPFCFDREGLEAADQEWPWAQVNGVEACGCFEAATKEEAPPIRPSRQASEKITATRLLVDQQLLESAVEMIFAALARAPLEDAALFVAAPR